MLDDIGSMILPSTAIYILMHSVHVHVVSCGKAIENGKGLNLIIL